MALQIRGLNGHLGIWTAFDNLIEAAKAEQARTEPALYTANTQALYAQVPKVTTGAPTSTPGQTAQQQTQNPTPSTVVTMSAASTPWYKTWWGLGLIAAGGYVGYRKLVKKS